jgi:topoisomerase-4 subunit A
MRISKFDAKAQDKINALEGNIEQVKHDLEHLIDFGTISETNQRSRLR